MRRFWHEPLVHFLLAGGLLFFGYGLIGGGEADEGEAAPILVDRAALVTFLQYRAKLFDAETFGNGFDALDEKAKAALVADYVDEEILYREARKLGLEAGDFVIRQRLIQKARFLMEEPSEAEPDEAGLMAFYEANADFYREPATVSFSHVYFSAAERGEAQAEAEATALLSRLKASDAGFADAPRHGDRFPYLVNYVERTPDYVADHFGSEMTGALLSLPSDTTGWVGPFRSPLGYHLAFVAARTAPRIAPFAEIREHVVADYRDEKRRATVRKALDQLWQGYDIRIDLGEASAE